MSVFSPGSEEGSPMLAMSASPLPSGDCGWDGVLDCDCEVPLSPASDTILYPRWPSRCGGRTTPDRSPSRYPPTHVPRLQSAGSMSVRPPEYPPPFETRSRCCGIHGSSSTRRSGFPPLKTSAPSHNVGSVRRYEAVHAAAYKTRQRDVELDAPKCPAWHQEMGIRALRVTSPW